MKIVCTLIALFVSTLGFAQEEKLSIIEEETVNFKSISYSLNSLKEIKNLDWDKVKTVFESDNKQTKIEMTFSLKDDTSKYNIKRSITVSGKSGELDSFITKAKKAAKTIVKLNNK